MPNWCYTNVTIYHNDEEKIKALHKKIEEWTSKNFVKNDFGNMWLGNIVGNSGIADPLSKDAPKCRGHILDITLDNNRITLSEESAWGPHVKMWKMLCDKYLPGAEIYYTAEETGCCLFWSNEPEVIGKYNVDLWEPPSDCKFESESDAEEKYVVEFLQYVFNTKETDIQKLLNMMNDMEDQWFGINQYRKVEIDETE